MISKKIIKVGAIALIGTMCTGIKVFADTGEFNFSIPVGELEYSDSVKKSDSEQNWYCTPTFYALGEGDYVKLTVCSQDKDTTYTSLKANDLKRYIAAYSSSNSAKANKRYTLKGKCPANKTSGGVTMSGRWTP